MNYTDQRVAEAFNEWLRRYEQEPEAYEAEFRTIEQFKREEADGVIPSYGETCVQYLRSILRTQSVPKKKRAKTATRRKK